MRILKQNLAQMIALCLAGLSSCGPMARTPRQDAPARASESLLVIHPHEYEPTDVRGRTTVFLAGTIDNGNSENWQQTIAGELAGKERKYILYNPRQEEWHPEREGEMAYQVRWELEHMEKADYILMVFLPGSQSPITLLELGLHARNGKLLVVCTPGFYRYDNVQITCERYGVPLYSSLDQAILALP